VVAKKTNPGGCKKKSTFLGGCKFAKKANYSQWLKKKLFPVVAKSQLFPVAAWFNLCHKIQLTDSLTNAA
jgi:hypothetical protein